MFIFRAIKNRILAEWEYSVQSAYWLGGRIVALIGYVTAKRVLTVAWTVLFIYWGTSFDFLITVPAALLLLAITNILRS